jgi:hypothetical protein
MLIDVVNSNSGFNRCDKLGLVYRTRTTVAADSQQLFTIH